MPAFLWALSGAFGIHRIRLMHRIHNGPTPRRKVAAMKLIKQSDGGTLAGISARWLAGGVAGIRELLALLRDNARAAASNPMIRALAEQIIATAPARNPLAEAAAVQAWIRANIRYTRDPVGVELVKPPAALILPGNRSDDCDGHAQLAAALLASVGHTVRLSAIGFQPERFAHVFAETWIGGAWRSVETTTASPVPVGYLHPGVVIKMAAALSNSDAPTLAGFSLKKLVKKVIKPAAKIGGLVAAVTVPGAAPALLALEAAKGKTQEAKAQVATANATAAIANAQTAQVYAPAPAPYAAPNPARASDFSAFVEQNKPALFIGGSLLIAAVALRGGGR